jgi:hypothetical protein
VERVTGFLMSMTMEMQMLARACGKSSVHHLEPEDLRALTLEASMITGIELAGTGRAFGVDAIADAVVERLLALDLLGLTSAGAPDLTHH